MKKAELETELAKVNEHKRVLRNCVIDIRSAARQAIQKGQILNSTWVIEKVTEAITRTTS